MPEPCDRPESALAQGDNGLLTITTSEGSTPKLKNPAFLFGLNVQGIEYNKTVKLATA